VETQGFQLAQDALLVHSLVHLPPFALTVALEPTATEVGEVAV
jgi:hypothetical protein